MATIQKSIRLPEEAVKDIEALASVTGKDFSGVARDLLIEAVKMRRCPGIIFADGPTGRRARIAGSGIDIWEFVAMFKCLGENYNKLKKTYHFISYWLWNRRSTQSKVKKVIPFIIKNVTTLTLKCFFSYSF